MVLNVPHKRRPGSTDTVHTRGRLLECLNPGLFPGCQNPASHPEIHFAHIHGSWSLDVPVCLCTSLILIPASCWKPLCLLPIAQLLRTSTTNQTTYTSGAFHFRDLGVLDIFCAMCKHISSNQLNLNLLCLVFELFWFLTLIPVPVPFLFTIP